MPGYEVNWDEVPDSNLVPDGTYSLTVEDIEETQSANGKLMYNASYRIGSPKEFKDMPIFENFVVGTDDDKMGASPATWTGSFAVRRMKQLSKAAQVPFDRSVDNLLLALRGAQFVASVVVDTDDGKKNPQYKGTKRNRITDYYPLGARMPGVAEAPTGPGRPLIPPTARPAVTQVQRKLMGANQQLPADTDGQQAPAASARRPQPAQPASLAPPSQATTRGAKVAPPVQCGECGEMVPRAGFQEHIEAHEAGDQPVQ